MQPASDHTAAIIRQNWQRVRAEVDQACHAAGRTTEQVQIVGVSKYVAPEYAWQLVQAGCHILAENRPQALWEKTDYFAHQSEVDIPPAQQALQWHLIGHLQRNKLKRTVPLIDLLHSLDSQRLAQAINAEAERQGLRCRVLLEVNVTQDTNKTGMSIAQVRRLLALTDQLPAVEFCGLMAMSSLDANPQHARREFEGVRELRDQLQDEFVGQVKLTELSMGMSGDFREAIAAGATLVRIGSNLWQGLLAL